MDAITFLGLGHVFTANMTGNTVLLGLACGQGDVPAGLRLLMALGGFILGVAAGAVTAGPGRGRGTWTPAATRAVGGEAAVLAVLAVTWHAAGPDPRAGLVYALVGLSALAMGIQSAAVRHLDVPGVATTYVTGTLTTLVAGTVERFRTPAPRSAAAPPAPPVAPPHTGLGLLALVLLVYGLAAVAGGILAARWLSSAPFLPLLAVAVVAVVGATRNRAGRRRYRGEAEGPDGGLP
jgi:uncharacterized membrane protein YoaK (UPF0700 family)